MNKVDDLCEFIKPLIEASDMTGPDKNLVLRSRWTFEQVPKIRSHEQYAVYSKLQSRLEQKAQLPDDTDPGFGKAFIEFARSRDGLLITLLGERMTEWEEREEY
jgi:hypothetical protein